MITNMSGTGTMTLQYNWENGLLLTTPTFPKSTVEYQSLLDSEQYAELEDLLMEHLDTAPETVAFFLPAYRTLIRKHENKRVSALLEMHVETLKTRRDLASEIILLQSILGFWPECCFVRDQLLGHLKNMYVESGNFKQFVQQLRISDDVTGVEPFRQLELRLRYDEGRVVYIPSKGVGVIREVNPKLGVIRLLLTNGEKMSLRIDEAERLSQSLEEHHFLARTVNDIDVLKQIASDDPGELLRLLFESVKREVTPHELREMLAEVIPESDWNTWWARARRDPRLIVGSGKKPMLQWSDSVTEGDTLLLEAFEKAERREKIELLKKHAARSESLALTMARILAEEALRVLAVDPAFSLETGLTIADIVQCKAMEMPFQPGDLFSRDDAEVLIAGIRNRLIRRKAVLQLAASREDWPLMFMKLLKAETDTAVFKSIVDSLYTADRGDLLDPEIERTFSNLSHNVHFYIWLCREIPSRTELRKYANWNLIRSLLAMLDNSSSKEHVTVVRGFFDPGGVIDLALETLDEATARMALDVLARTRGLEEYRKESVRQKLLILFPVLHKKKKDLLLVTKEALDKKRVEYQKLIKKDIPKAAREIQRTREYGDLRENFEYHEARRQQELLSSRAKTLHDELIDASAIEPDTVDTSKISIGTRCRLEPEAAGDTPVTLTILGPWDSDPDNNILSYTSAAGHALLNAPKGSSVTFNDAAYVVDAIEIWLS